MASPTVIRAPMYWNGKGLCVVGIEVAVPALGANE
jgi:hypothetical protein